MDGASDKTEGDRVGLKGEAERFKGWSEWLLLFYKRKFRLVQPPHLPGPDLLVSGGGSKLHP